MGTSRLVESEVADPSLLYALQQMAEPSWNIDRTAELAGAEARVIEYLGRYHEEPTGAEYYLYSSLLLTLMGLPAIREGSVRVLDKLLEYSMRFAGHVDWQLKKSRILTVEPRYFQSRERSVWADYANLGGARINDCATKVLSDVVNLGSEYSQAIGQALCPQASADYVVIYDASDEPRVLTSAGRGWPGVRFETAGPIYLDNLDDANRTFFEDPRYLYLWAPSAESTLPFLSDILGVRSLVDPRREDGMVMELSGFVSNPVETTRAW